MAHILRVTDGTNTITLTTSPIKMMQYSPLVSMDGADIQETTRVDFYSATQATNYANIQAINKLFTQARNYDETQTGVRVYVEFDPGTSGVIYRSLIKNGSILPDPEVLQYKFFDNKNLVMEVKWTRVPFWEAPLTQIPLFNTSA